MNPTRFFLIRHALVTPQAREVIYGNMDVALCDAALRGEVALHRWLATHLPRTPHWVVTPLSRTRATAAAIFAAGYPAQDLVVEPDMAEQSQGEWQGVTHEALTERLRHPPHPFWPHAAEERPPGGESISDVRARVGPVLDGLARRLPGTDIVMVAHGGTIRAALAHALDVDGHRALSFSVKNLSLTQLEKHGGDWRVVSVNEEPRLPA